MRCRQAIPGRRRHPRASGCPRVTPFRDGALDEASLARLVRHYGGQPIDGLILAATTGEGMTLEEVETRRAVDIAAAARTPRQGLFLGLAGSDTRRLARRPDGFSVLTGGDALFHGALAQGADGGILAAAHAETRLFAGVRERHLAGDAPAALALWRPLFALARLFFAEPSPAAVKHWLWRIGLLDSPEVRLPMTGVTPALAARLDAEILRRGGADGPAAGGLEALAS